MGELIKGFHNPETVRTALLAIAINGGNSQAAHDALKEQGIDVSPRTLRNWRNNQYPQLYRELHDTHGREIEQAIVPGLRELMIRSVEGAQLAADKSIEQLKAGDVKDPATMGRNLMVTGATAMDKLYLATDRPTSVTEHRDVAEILRSLEKHAARQVEPPDIEGTAVPLD